MPVITDIRQQIRHTAWYSVYLDRQYAFSLSDLELSGSGLRNGDVLTEADATLWRRRSGEGRAYDVALRYLAYRARSCQEMQSYLLRKGYALEVVELVMERLNELRLLDDRAFAQQWVQERQKLRPRSRRVLINELKAKGIELEMVQQVLAGMGETGEIAALEEVIMKKRRQGRYQDAGKLAAYLGRQGFEYHDIKKALARLDD